MATKWPSSRRCRVAEVGAGRFRIIDAPLAPLVIESSARMTNAGAGAFNIFEGRVRNEHRGRAVLRLDYQAYTRMAEHEGDKVLAEAIERFGLLDALCLHRVGRLEIGEPAVWVGALAGHRDASFGGCRYVIDEIKQRVPIWKREYYVDGESDWIQGAG
ncbi:MAG: molybdenum cofactor biosynthesis protein MoaE [Xanthomonadales bacterium]|nr:molybdenum cofactor biosynthesis protein MoaE [Xanthomonadales bacterium]